MSGRYRRGGRHEGRGGRGDKAGWEAETVVTVPNAPNKPNSFPILTTGLTMHQPGRIKHRPRIALGFHAQEFDESQRGFLLADRAYNGSKPARFQKHVMKMRFRTVYDYKKKNAGKHGQIDDVIFVGGRPHSMYMPEPLVTARDDYEASSIDRATYESRMASRHQYELKDHGRPDSEGRQRFTYPNLSKVLCIDPATKKVVKPAMKKVTFTLAPEDAASMRVIKHLQAFEHKSDEWKQWYGMRSHVESNNQHVKADAETDLGNPRSAARAATPTRRSPPPQRSRCRICDASSASSRPSTREISPRNPRSAPADERTSTVSRCHTQRRPRPHQTEQQDSSSPEKGLLVIHRNALDAHPRAGSALSCIRKRTRPELCALAESFTSISEQPGPHFQTGPRCARGGS